MTISHFLGQIYQHDPSFKTDEQQIIQYLKENLVGKTSFVVDQRFLDGLRSFLSEKKQEAEKQITKKRSEDKIREEKEKNIQAQRQQIDQSVEEQVIPTKQHYDHITTKETSAVATFGTAKKPEFETESKSQAVFVQPKKRHFFAGFFVGVVLLVGLFLYQVIAPHWGLPILLSHDILTSLGVTQVFAPEMPMEIGRESTQGQIERNMKKQEETYTLEQESWYSLNSFIFPQNSGLQHIELRASTGDRARVVQTGDLSVECLFVFSGILGAMPQTGQFISLQTEIPMARDVLLEINTGRIMQTAQALARCPQPIETGSLPSYTFDDARFVYKKYRTGKGLYLVPAISFPLISSDNIRMTGSVDIVLISGFYE